MVHTSPPRGMQKGCSWEGCARPHPPAGGGRWGNPVSPSPCVRAAPAHTLPPVGADGETRCPHLPAHGRSPPTPSRRWGQMGKPGFPIPLRAGAARPPPPAGGGRWGNPVSPSPCARAQPAHGARVWENLVPPCSRLSGACVYHTAECALLSSIQGRILHCEYWNKWNYSGLRRGCASPRVSTLPRRRRAATMKRSARCGAASQWIWT